MGKQDTKDKMEELYECNTCNELLSIDHYTTYREKPRGKCRECVAYIDKLRREGKQEEVVALYVVRAAPDYTIDKECNQCGVVKPAEEYPKNGHRRKNTCKSCVSVSSKTYRESKVYDDVVEAFNCRSCDVLVAPAEVYIENKRTNKPCTQCKDCYFADVNNRKARRRVKIKESRQVNTVAEEARIREIYRQCKKLNKSGTIKYEVDHIRPLSKGGAHHPDNLQVLTMEDNRIKGDKYE